MGVDVSATIRLNHSNILDHDPIPICKLAKVRKSDGGHTSWQTAEFRKDRDKKISSIDQRVAGTRLSQSMRLEGGWGLDRWYFTPPRRLPHVPSDRQPGPRYRHVKAARGGGWRLEVS